MGPPPGHYPPVGHSMLTAMSYQPMPLQPVDWYNPSNPSTNENWIPGGAVYQPNSRHHKKSITDAQQVSVFKVLRTQCQKKNHLDLFGKLNSIIFRIKVQHLWRIGNERLSPIFSTFFSQLSNRPSLHPPIYRVCYQAQIYSYGYNLLMTFTIQHHPYRFFLVFYTIGPSLIFSYSF